MNPGVYVAKGEGNRPVVMVAHEIDAELYMAGPFQKRKDARDWIEKYKSMRKVKQDIGIVLGLLVVLGMMLVWL